MERYYIIVTFPAHCLHLLDAVYSPFKSWYAVALNAWMISNPGRAITAHNLAMIVNTMYQSTFNIRNIIEEDGLGKWGSGF